MSKYRIERQLFRLRKAVAVLQNSVDDVFETVSNIEKKVDQLMALVDDLKAGIKKLDDETTHVASLIASLVARLQTGTLSPAEQDEVLAALTALSDRLTELGKDPSNPVPPPPPAMALAQKTAGKP